MSNKKPYNGYCVTISVLLVLAAVLAVVVGLLTYFGILFTFTEPLWILIGLISVGVIVLVLWIWFLCICKSLRKNVKPE